MSDWRGDAQRAADRREAPRLRWEANAIGLLMALGAAVGLVALWR